MTTVDIGITDATTPPPSPTHADECDTSRKPARHCPNRRADTHQDAASFCEKAFIEANTLEAVLAIDRHNIAYFNLRLVVVAIHIAAKYATCEMHMYNHFQRSCPAFPFGSSAYALR